MKGPWAALTLVAGMSLAGVSPAVANDIVPSPESGSEDRFRDVPEHWRAYFRAAREVDQRADPLERCLAYPDLPGTQWPEGYSAHHCHYHFGRVPTVAETAALVSAGDIGALEQRLHALLATHDTEVPEREGVHRFFQQLANAPDEAMRITEHWVALAPDSALAAIGHGSALAGGGWAVRGTDWSSQTPASQMRAMSALFEQAGAQFRRAITLQPDWVYGYLGLIDIAKGDRDETGEWAFEEANDIDPGCAELAFRRMRALEPRWGGSWNAMEAYSRQLEPHVTRRPLLANQVSQPYVDFVSMLGDEQRAMPEMSKMLEHAVQISGQEAGLNAAAQALLAAREGQPDTPRGIAMLLQQTRFQPAGPWADREIGRYLVDMDPAWAKGVLQRAVAEEPGNAFGRYYLAAAFYDTGDFAGAEPHYLAAAEDPRFLARALGELATMWLLDSEMEPRDSVTKVRPYVERLLAAHPQNVDGLYLRIAMTAVEPSGRLDKTLIREYLAVTKGGGPRHERRRAEMRRVLEAMEQVPPAEVSFTFE